MQYVANSLVAASVILLAGVGFHIIYRTASFLHFAHGLMIALGAYGVLFWGKTIGLELYAACPLAIASTVGIAGFMEVTCYTMLRRRGASSLTLLLASLGVYVIGQNLIAMAYGEHTQSIRSWPAREGWSVLGARITIIQITTIGTACLAFVILLTITSFTRLGKTMRAVANDPWLAGAVGINVIRVYSWAMLLGSALAGLCGVLIACDVDMTPEMGMRPMLLGVVAAIIGGERIWGTACAAILVACAQQCGAIWLSSQWQDAIAFLILLIFLLFRPRGIAGTVLRTESV